LDHVVLVAIARLTQTPKPVIAMAFQKRCSLQTAGRRNEGPRLKIALQDSAMQTVQWTRQMAKFNPFQFLQEVRSETSKVTWPTRKEVMITTAMVFVLVIVASIFFTLADQIIRVALTALGIGR
jgi:preprotein translocase subunit SecE